MKKKGLSLAKKHKDKEAKKKPATLASKKEPNKSEMKRKTSKKAKLDYPGLMNVIVRVRKEIQLSVLQRHI